MSNTTNQEVMQKLHDTINHLITHHYNGLLSDLEFVYAISSAGADAELAFLQAQQPMPKDALTGLIDPNTGLKY